MPTDLSTLEAALGVTFANTDLLRQALTHRSYLNENPTFPLDHNERLEFLGDAVIEPVVTDYLYRAYQNSEGELTNWRAALVNFKLLGEVGRAAGLEPHLLLSKGESRDTGRARLVILANAIEAVVGAVYLDQGYEASRSLVERLVLKELPRILAEKTFKDPKSRFQEIAQERANETPVYKVLADWGPDHQKSFRVGLYVGKDLVAEGEGLSKQEAEEQAARTALGDARWR